MPETPHMFLAGPLFVGVILNWALLGALIIQIYDYHTSFRNDRRAVQILVHFVSGVELIQTGCVTHTAWWHLVENWGKPNGLLEAPWTSTYISVLNGIASASVQGFFAWRIWLFESKSIGRLSSVIIITALTQCSAAIWVAVEFTRASRNIANIALINAAAETWLVGSLVCDLIITITMVIILVSARRRANSKSTMSLLNNLIISTIETGAITAVLALIQLVLYKVYPSNYMHVTVEFVLGRLYCNILLTILNSRRREPEQSGNDLNNFRSTIKFNHGTEMNPFPAGRVKLDGGKNDAGNVDTSSSLNPNMKDPHSKATSGLC